MICQNIGLSVGNSSRMDKLNFKFLLTVNMYMNMLMIAYRLISIEKRENIHFKERLYLRKLCLFWELFYIFLFFSFNLSLLIE